MFCLICGKESARFWAVLVDGKLAKAKYRCHACDVVYSYDVAAAVVEIDCGMQFRPLQQQQPPAAPARGGLVLLQGGKARA